MVTSLTTIFTYFIRRCVRCVSEGGAGGSTEAEPAVRPWMRGRTRRGREKAGLPQEGETPLGLKFFKHWVFVNLCPHFHFLGAKIYSLLYVAKFIILVKTTS